MKDLDFDNCVYHEIQSSNYRFDSSAVDSIFLNKLKRPTDLMFRNEYYERNSFGFRSDEFIDNPDILFAGDSFVFGTGIPLKYLWSNLIAKEKGVSHQNLGSPGGSVFIIVSNIFEYCRMYGNPKTLLCIFPDFYRFTRTKNYNYGYNKYDNNRFKKDQLTDTNYWDNIQHVRPEGMGPKVVKLPTEIENILAPDNAYFLSMTMINLLEQYCKSSGINLLWTTWQEGHSRSIQKIQDRNSYGLSGFIDIENYNWEWDLNLEDMKCTYSLDKECHRDLKNEDPTRFDIGFDAESGLGEAHWGSHRHQHVADIFTDAIAKRFLI